MAQNKTQPTDEDVNVFLGSIENERRRNDGIRLLGLFNSITEEKPVMWGPSIVGYGSYHYRYESGREGDFLITGFSPRKQHLVIYIMPGFEKYPELMAKLGKYKTGSSCLYINKLADIDIEILRQLIAESVSYMRKKYPQ